MDLKIDDVSKTKGIHQKKKKSEKAPPIWTRIKEKVKIPDLIQLENNRCECLQFGNTTAPSCQYNDMDEILYCHKCQKIMDVIQVYGIINKLERSEAIRKMAILYSVPFGKVDIKHIKMEKKIQDLFQDFTDRCYNNPEFQNKFKLIEMKKRGFSDDTIKQQKIGLYNDSIKEYINKTYTKELLKNAGFINQKGYWILRNDKIVYPYLDRNGAPRYFIYRKIDKEEKK